MSDLISRKDACEAVKNEMESWLEGDRCDYRNVVDAIMDLPSAEPEIIRCKDCKYFHYDKPYVVFGVPVLGHEVCDKWGDGCKTSEYGFCFLAERRGDKE